MDVKMGIILKWTAVIMIYPAMVCVMILSAIGVISGIGMVILLLIAGVQILLIYAFGTVLEFLEEIKHNTGEDAEKCSKVSAALPQL